MTRTFLLCMLLCSALVSFAQRNENYIIPVDAKRIAEKSDSLDYGYLTMLDGLSPHPVDSTRYGCLSSRLKVEKSRWVTLDQPIDSVFAMAHRMANKKGESEIYLRVNRWRYESTYGEGYPRVYLEYHLDLFGEMDGRFRYLDYKIERVSVPGSVKTPEALITMTENEVAKILLWADSISESIQSSTHAPLEYLPFSSLEDLPKPYGISDMRSRIDGYTGPNALFSTLDGLLHLKSSVATIPTILKETNTGYIILTGITSQEALNSSWALAEGRLLMRHQNKYLEVQGLEEREPVVHIPWDDDSWNSYFMSPMISLIGLGIDAADGKVLDSIATVPIDELSGRTALFSDPASNEEAWNWQLGSNLGHYMRLSVLSKCDSIVIEAQGELVTLQKKQWTTLPFTHLDSSSTQLTITSYPNRIKKHCELYKYAMTDKFLLVEARKSKTLITELSSSLFYEREGDEVDWISE